LLARWADAAGFLRLLPRRLAAAARALENMDSSLRVRAVMDWIEQVRLTAQPLVSVIVPTRDRCAYLPRAIESLQRQSYERWEAIIVDDGSTDGTAALLAALPDGRCKALPGNGAGVCAARNIGLAAAGGDFIAYLDDDNLMHPQWLKSVAWAFEQHPESEVLYGALIVDDPARIQRAGRGEMPRLFFFSYDAKTVARRNIADMGCIAHRAGLAEAYFDTRLLEAGDWDVFLRLTKDKPPLALPAIACYYTTDAPNRSTNGPTQQRDYARVMLKNRR